MTDRELLELAAKAAGYGELRVLDDSSIIVHCRRWHPLADDGDALRLAVKLGINLEIGEPGFGDVQAGKRDHWAAEWLNADNPCASVRRAIVCAAAEIGRGMP
ncbi:hypothetical protein CIW54_07455 [Paraburkholderia sp. T12-10]|nr:hypothetical protein CIW54_07455 [Paraburkholderia sp. T12-10]